jgi:hypothetical protein
MLRPLFASASLVKPWDMGGRGKSLILGLAIGAVGTLLYLRIKQVREDEDPNALMERLSEQMEALERSFAGPRNAD